MVGLLLAVSWNFKAEMGATIFIIFLAVPKNILKTPVIIS